jgi:DNA-binding NtrC family response regulator
LQHQPPAAADRTAGLQWGDLPLHSLAPAERSDKNLAVPGMSIRTGQSMTERSILCVSPKLPTESMLPSMRAAGWDVRVATDLKGAHRVLQDEDVLVGLLMPADADEQTFAELDVFLASHGAPEWVGAFKPEALALPCCRDLIVNRLFDHHTLPLDPQRLLATLGHAHGHAALRHIARRGADVARDHAIIGQTEVIRDLLRQLRRMARVDAPVLVCGESGSGKELAAQAIHRESARAQGPFIAVNCGAIQPTLIQSELFGHVKGAFTGAAREERGLIEAASGGTIFLDEIGDLPLELQINLLRFLQEKTINRVGSTRSIRVDVRVVAATNVDLERAVAEGSFRQDLFYRLNVLSVTVPPLRARKADIELLAEHFFDKFGNEKSPQVKGFSQRARLAMTEHDWPGNVRELINRVRRAMVMTEGRLITAADLGLERQPEVSRNWDALDEARCAAERHAIFATLEHVGANVTEAARKLGVSRMTLYRLMAKHGIAH